MPIPKSFEHALDMLPHLAKCAKERRTMTYQELGDLIGMPAFFLGQPLDIVRDQILAKHNLPRLDALVVNKESGEAGGSFYAEGRSNFTDEEYKELLDYERQRVYDFPNWEETVLRIQAHYGGEAYLKSRK